MKINYLVLFSLLAGVLIGCSRPEPSVAVGPTPTLLPIVVNEVYSRGDSLNPDWVELYNPNTASVVIGNFKIYDSGGQTGSIPKKQIPPGTTLAGLGFYVITVDTSDASGFGLSSSGETIWLENVPGTVIDSIVFPALGVDTSYARTIDGGPTWGTLSLPTKGSANATGGPALPVMMNEVYSRGVAGNLDWVEIYNPNSAPVTLTGYRIYDSGGQTGAKPKKVFSSGATIPANGYYVIVVDTADYVGDTSDFGISSGGEQLWLENPAGTVIDNVNVTAMDVTQTYARIPNGGTNWQLTNTITKGAQNQ